MEPTKAAVRYPRARSKSGTKGSVGGKPGAKLADPVGLGISAREYGGVRDHGQRRLGESLLENHALASQSIEVRRDFCL